jgi:hypothetical protein
LTVVDWWPAGCRAGGGGPRNRRFDGLSGILWYLCGRKAWMPAREQEDYMDLDKTFEFATNLDRAAIEGRLEEVRAAADSLLLADVAQQLTGIAGASREEMGKRITAALEALEGSGQKRLIALLELAELNLPNL